MIKAGDWVVRTKYPTKHLEMGKPYQVSDGSTEEDFIRLVGVPGRTFDPEYFELWVPEWKPGAQVICVNPNNELGWAKDAAQHGETYTIAHATEIHLTLTANFYAYKKEHFKLVGGENYVAPPPQKTIIYNQKATA